MYICYVDESGDLSSLTSTTCNLQPLLVIIGLFVHADKLSDVTKDFLHLKQKFFPGLSPTGRDYLDWVLAEVKGSELRKYAASTQRKEWRHAIGFLGKTLELLDAHSVKIVGHIWVKGIGVSFDGRATYTRSVQTICADFQHFLNSKSDSGFIIADSRDHQKDRYVSHSIFTQKFRSGGDPYPNILEMPTFGRSDNHIGIQVADYICSAIMWPIAINCYCSTHLSGVHIRPGYLRIRQNFAQRIKSFFYRYQDGIPRWHGGLCVHDAIAGRPTGDFFK